MVLPKLGSGRAHLGVPVAEAAAAAGWVMGLQVERPWTASERRQDVRGWGGRAAGGQMSQGGAGDPATLT